ncbi:Rossmann fold domain-containing protein [Novosphingobium mangrovi (ex Huang et al. 2023)]|uniref:Short chain dehydrogenase-like proteobacteria domain-containing protein n=1 Tax=Novosphingobium mangrovi (ex Huang et al. 2023) TaxID=2976432 RepID=A0ABT2I0F1_9SPHN|nr:hypothetical protein [Novosphingobium mangrovi (ex Huang et al. 2023)]MCT2398281.1 hypothetical protein [Novosphingobium mangrovi (ex Huang et al. 2023)]
MELLHIGPLADDPLEASADFHARLLSGVETTLGAGADPLTLVFLPARHEHRAWRLAVVQGLARRFAPSRVNALECDDSVACAAAARWLDGAGGVTGQLLPLDGNGAGPVLYPQG